MSKPIVNTPVVVLPFEQRLKLVQQEITNRLSAFPANQRNGQRAAYWRRWIMRNVLEVQG